MTEAARWGPKAFLCTPEKLVPLMDLKSSMSIDSDTQSSSSGTGQTNAKGKKPEVINITTRYIRGTGIDPWGQVEEWRSLLGQSNPLYIGEKKFGIGNFMLTNVSAEDFYLSNAGEFIGVKVAITLEEVVAKATTSEPNTKKGLLGGVTDSLSIVKSATQKLASSLGVDEEIVKQAANYAATALVNDYNAKKTTANLLLGNDVEVRTYDVVIDYYDNINRPVTSAEAKAYLEALMAKSNAEKKP